MDTSSKVLDREELMQRLTEVKNDDLALQEWIYPKMIGIFEALRLHSKTEPEDIASLLFVVLVELEEKEQQDEDIPEYIKLVGLEEQEEEDIAGYINLVQGIVKKTLEFSFIFTGDREQDKEVRFILFDKFPEHYFPSAD